MEHTSDQETSGANASGPPPPQVSNRGPELFIALVGAVGTDLSRVSEALSRAFKAVNYDTGLVRLSHLFHEVPNLGLPATPEDFERATPADDRYAKYMDAGNELRRTTQREDAAAMLGVGAIRRKRSERADPNMPRQRYVYLIRSLKHLGELRRLRAIYGSSLFALAAYSRRDQRVETLARLIADSRYELGSMQYREPAERLVQRDEQERDPFGQSLRHTFPEADVFVDADNTSHMEESISRFVELVFGNFRHAPSPDEQGMYFARAASLRSSDLGRQVGAAITSERGEMISAGTNEVPRAGGGTYWEGDVPDGRDVIRGYDIGARFKQNLIGDLLLRLQKAGWLGGQYSGREVSELLGDALSEGKHDVRGPLRDARVTDVIEFGRTVHAEMAALMDAARVGVPVKDSALYTTTFPCHLCAKHIVAAGVRRVVYIEPYPKSLTAELYPDSVAVESAPEQGQIGFTPFIGIAPRRYWELFEQKGERKSTAGDVLTWDPVTASPQRFEDAQAYADREELELRNFAACLHEVGWSVRG